MYLPRTLPLCEPHVATWIGASGRRYDFAVSRPATTWLDEAAVFLLVKCEGGRTDVLHVGHTCSLHRRFGLARERCPEIWRRALSVGMTHVHLRFEACSEQARQAEVDDLLAALHPTLLVQSMAADETLIQPSPALAEVAADASGDVLIPYRARLKPTQGRDPHIDIEAFDLDLGRGDLPFGHAYEASRSLRADPAREYGEAFDDFEAVLREVQLTSEPVAAIVVLPAQPAVIEEAGPEQGRDDAADVVAVLAAQDESGLDQVAPTGAEEPVEVMAAEDDGLPPAQTAESVAAQEPAPAAGSAQAVGPVEAPQPQARAGKEARGLFGRWLHAMAERGGRWLGTPSRSHAAAKAAPDASFDGSAVPVADRAEAAVTTIAEKDIAALEGSRAEAAPPPAAAAAQARGMADVPETGSPAAAAVVGAAAATDTPAELPVAVTTAPVEAPVGMAVLGAAEAAAFDASGAFPDDLIAEAPSIAVIDLLADDSVAQPAPILADEAIPQAGEERHETYLRSLGEGGRREGTSMPAAVAGEDGRGVIETAKRACAFDPAKPVVLFADEVSPEAGADILADAIITVCGSDGSAQFAFAGEGGLRDELQQRFWRAGLGDRCRFLGDVPTDRFERLLAAADILVVPARVRRDEGLASLALAQGKWVLATHQSEIACIQHGQNGLVTYDNPGSLVWGVRELLGRAGHPHQDARAEAA